MTAEEMSEANLEIILKLTNVWPTLPEEKKIALSAVIGCSNVAISHTTMHTIISRLLSGT